MWIFLQSDNLSLLLSHCRAFSICSSLHSQIEEIKDNRKFPQIKTVTLSVFSWKKSSKRSGLKLSESGFLRVIGTDWLDSHHSSSSSWIGLRFHKLKEYRRYLAMVDIFHGVSFIFQSWIHNPHSDWFCSTYICVDICICERWAVIFVHIYCRTYTNTI